MSAFSFSQFSSCYLCLFVFVALFHLCLSNQNFDDVLCIEEERQALLRFKLGLIDEGGRLASWVGEKNDCCKWAGIVCDDMTGHVRQIHLRALDGLCNEELRTLKEQKEASKQKLKGELSPSLLDLKQLEHLDLSCNDFGGNKVSEFIGSLGNLRYLNLSSSNFSGIVPPQLGNLSELHTLCLGSFQDRWSDRTPSVINMEWLSSLRLLSHLDMSYVDLSKAMNWLQVINTLPSLAELHFRCSRLLDVHSHVPSLNVTSLLLLDLSENEFIDHSLVPNWIFSITSLVSLDLSMCNFCGLIPSSAYSFRNLTSLKLLHVSGNTFMNSSLVIKELSSGIGNNLISLYISDCDISSKTLDSLHNLTSLLSLGLSWNQLTNRIPKSLGNLCNLRDIDLSFNYFQNISATYLLESILECKSPRLESLYISDSGLSGLLPDQLGQLVHMEHLELGYNQISGTIPDSIGRLCFLRTLSFMWNRISGPIPFSIGRLSSLEALHLEGNQIEGSLPDSIGQLSKLKLLDFYSNNMTGLVTETHFVKLVRLKNINGGGNNLMLRPKIANWTPPFQLTRLNLSYWGLGPQFPSWLISQRELIALDISNTNISSPMPESFWGSFPDLENLDISKNQIQGMLSLSGIPTTLDSLDLSSNMFRGELPNVSNNSFPLLLDLSNNFFVGSLHHLLCSDGQKVTRILNLGNNSFSGIIPECWEKWQQLSFLNMENNKFSGGIPKTLGHVRYIQALNMHGNNLVGKLPASLMNLKSLKILELGGNKLDGNIPSSLGTELASLCLLNLRSNNFVGNIPHEFCYLTRIQILDLSNNKLEGNIPRCFNNFSILSGETTFEAGDYNRYDVGTKHVITSDSLVMKGHEYTYSTILGFVRLLDMSSNNLVGHIPSELTTLTNLQSLNLSRNQLTGMIPEKIGDMKELESFDLSVNKLSGELPMSLSNLNSLSSFNVSCNNLIGKIPSSTQLQSLEESCFVGNKLCGDPLTKPCSRVPDTYHEEDDGSHGSADWGLIISVVSGFIVGFWVIVAPLILSRSWRIAYFRFLNDLGYMVYDVMHKLFSW